MLPLYHVIPCQPIDVNLPPRDSLRFLTFHSYRPSDDFWLICTDSGIEGIRQDASVGPLIDWVATTWIFAIVLYVHQSSYQQCDLQQLRRREMGWTGTMCQVGEAGMGQDLQCTTGQDQGRGCKSEDASPRMHVWGCTSEGQECTTKVLTKWATTKAKTGNE